ncbi:glycosyltransferase family 4 protein [Ralstonia mannitolilytica]|uniref:GDP-mannose-dependent alpha-mannosyltransferase n=1 Tax=Ralstonia mannitolilytica TaxID=105219 RepID=A0AAD2ALW5_9RALS|nr:glycosyltransferase family 1 protein [Ralstonia mannitolilytica]MBY4716934.1 glycosyltransferase family 1 protein [Ralstonia mannitolilytica]CAJ0680660.1 GDP-mannose-dependent alpha-mannosyltransferase [Ralstonia mannitolilytica]CAJ0685782.1 GDP-mannose-dependent alpha-mannosyltransferase [Ralstonia mannitolilytica]CAJ0717439.1 GDP-mannose-dependent alpha-mannosyltransferase [Ralstonia mannitolilytica]CAJ0862865.1 GDP-mannose-dependent alpha-mannosyltransferase [Ralstonia mannitolilytica]
MRIAYVTETWPPELNGVSLTAARTVAFLHARGHDVRVVRPRQRAIDAGQPALSEDALRVPGVPIPLYPDLRMGLPARRRLLRAWRGDPPDLVHVATEGPLGWSAVRAARDLGVPVTSDFRTRFDEYGRHYAWEGAVTLVRAYLRAFHNRTDRTFVPTRELCKQLGELGFERLSVSTRGVDARQFAPHHRSDALRAQWRAGSDTPVVLTVGRLALEKNLGVALDAFDAIRRRRPDARLVMVGDGPQRNALRRRCPDAVFAGTQHGQALAAHYASADVFLFPSLTETFGNVVVEAMASGLPVVAFDTAAAGMHVRTGQNGCLAPVGDVAVFTAAAVALAADGDLRQRLGRAARQTAQALDWPQVLERFEAALLAVHHAATTGEAYHGDARLA